MPYIEIKNKKKNLPKYSHSEDSDMQHPLSREYIANQKRRSLKYTKGGNK
jgi:hypothetical protein